ncbi:hypothetical protein PRIPAC_84246 [Pristionchus pacificus]|uniref:G protein-coupled receptor n=1 Tax=Pristionchus pacificus TaxID=54126 RepID=A0A2A6BVF9_PRIPA|nr:hypothetical protein PRIPAC_84246 [Pristionchus pacificus]|eukprot:PDM69806.1 G protein-coupled receptor [Pristionchus pacificus]
MSVLADLHHVLSLLFCCLATLSNGLLIALIAHTRKSYIGRLNREVAPMSVLADLHHVLSLLFCCLATLSNGLLIALIAHTRKSYIGRLNREVAPMSVLADLHHVLSLLFCCLATLSNGLLIALIAHTRKSYIGRYGILLTLFASHDILLSLLFAVVQPVGYISHFLDLGYILFAPMTMAVEIQDLLYYLTLFFYFNTLFLLSCHFVFRYVLVLGISNILYKLPAVVWVLIAVAGQISYQWSFTDPIQGTRPLRDAQHSHATKGSTMDSGAITVSIVQMRAPSGLQWQWDVIQSFLLVMIPPMIAMLVMSFCGLSILRRSRQIAPSSTHIHKHLLKALVVQASIPVVFIFVPLGLQFAMPLVGSKFGRAGMITATFTAFFPVVDPLLVIWIVPIYRNLLKKWCSPAFISRLRSPSVLHSTAVSKIIQSQIT